MDTPYLTYETEDNVLGYMRETSGCKVNLQGGEDSYNKLEFIHLFLLYIMNENRTIRHKIEDLV